MDSFERAASGWRAQVHRTSTRQWAETLRNVLQRHRCHRIAMGPVVFGLPGMDDALRGRYAITLERPVDEWRGLLFDEVDASITLATAGFCSSGIFGMDGICTKLKYQSNPIHITPTIT